MNNKNTFQFSSNKLNFQAGKTEKPYANENEIISDTPREVQSMIVDIFKVSQKYSKHNQVQGNESFEESLANMENSLDNMFSQSLVNLGSEIDYGKRNIEKYKTSLDYSQTILLDISNDQPSSNRRMFLHNYCQSLFEKQNLINESINILDSQFQDKALSESNYERSINLLLSTIKEQHEAIIRSSSRLYKINEKMELIRNKLQSYSSFDFNSDSFSNPQHPESNAKDLFLDLNNDKQIITTTTGKLIADYRAHMEERRRNLEKHITDRSLFVKYPAQKGGFTFGTGNKNGFKTNFGANNIFSSAFSGNTNRTIASKPENAVLSTPDTNSIKNAKDLTPVQKSSPSAGLTGLHLNSGSSTPWAPRKGAGGYRDDP